MTKNGVLVESLNCQEQEIVLGVAVKITCLNLRHIIVILLFGIIVICESHFCVLGLFENG
jgi:hypothetical protein